MAEDYQLLDVKRVVEPRSQSRGEPSDDDRRRRQKRHSDRDRTARETKDYFRTIAKAAEKSNEILKQRGAHFRFCVYLKDAEVMIDLVRLDATGNVIQTTTKKITNQDFNRWIEDVAQMEGLFLDTQV